MPLRKLMGWRLVVMAGSAVSVVMAVAGCHGKSAEEYLAAGDDALQHNQLATAEQDYNEAAKASPNDPRTHLALGNLYLVEHNTNAAKQELMRAVELDPKNVPAHLSLGKFYLSKGPFQLAEEQFLAAVALEPSNGELHMQLAQVYQHEDKLDAAERELRTAIGLAPKDGKTHFALANLLSTQPARSAEADAEYARAQALDPSLIRAGMPPAPSGAPIVNLGTTVVPAAAPTPMAAPIAAAPAPSPLKVKAVDKKFKLTHDSPVYQDPDSGSAVLSKVHRRKWIHVTGISGDWLQVRLRNGTVGFVPMSAAE
jgi:tetratricopeptide (TPR) repeat protein